MKYVCPLIVVKDIAVSRNFYEKILGQKIKYDFGENLSFEGDFSIHLEGHFKKLLGYEKEDVIKKAHNFELYFESDDLDTVMQKLKANQIQFIHEIREQPWGQRVARFYDPDYHIIELGETIESLILRFHQAGLNVREIEKRTSLPADLIDKVLLLGDKSFLPINCLKEV